MDLARARFPSYHLLLAALALLGGSCSSSSGEKRVLLERPVGLVARATMTGILVDWIPVVGATGYELFWSEIRGASLGDSTEVTTIQPSFLHTGIEENKTFCYVVRAFRGNHRSPPSSETCAILCPRIDGRLDTTFSGQGWVSPVGLSPSRAHSVTVDGSGRIIAAGQDPPWPPGGDMALWRFLEDGTLDWKFGII